MARQLINSPYQELDAFARLGAESVRVQVELGRFVGWKADSWSKSSKMGKSSP